MTFLCLMEFLSIVYRVLGGTLIHSVISPRSSEASVASSLRGPDVERRESIGMATMSSTGGAARLRPNPGAGVLLGEADGRESGESRGHGKGGTGTSAGLGSSAFGELTTWRVVKMIGILLGVVVVVGGLVYASTQLEIDLVEDIVPHVKNPVKFFALNVAVASFGVIPGAASATCVTAGILFGTLWGMALCVSSASIGAMVSFMLSRYVARPWVEKMFVRHSGRFKALDDAVSSDGSQIVILVRLSPFSPFTVASYMLGLTSVPFVSYAAATVVGLLPSSFVYVYIGDTGRRASGSDGATVLEIAFYILGLLMTLFVSYRIAVIAQDAMRAKVGLDWDPSTDSDEEVELDVFGSRIDDEIERAPLEDDRDDRDKPGTIL